jgi:hypothetical protein
MSQQNPTEFCGHRDFPIKDGTIHLSGVFVCNHCKDSIVEQPDNSDSNAIAKGCFAGFLLFFLIVIIIILSIILL